MHENMIDVRGLYDNEQEEEAVQVKYPHLPSFTINCTVYIVSKCPNIETIPNLDGP